MVPTKEGHEIPGKKITAEQAFGKLCEAEVVLVQRKTVPEVRRLQLGVIAFGHDDLPVPLHGVRHVHADEPLPTFCAGVCNRRQQVAYVPEKQTLSESRGDCPFPKDNRYSLDIATLAIFPDYVEFDGEEVLKRVVQGEAGRTIK